MKYRTSTIEVFLAETPEHIYEVMTNNSDYSWRSDVKRIDIIDEQTFVEIYPNDNQTIFTITEKKPYSDYRFQMENKRFHGYWTGKLTPKDDGTLLKLSEHLYVHNPVMRILAYMFMNLKKMQYTYVDDLKKKLDI